MDDSDDEDRCLSLNIQATVVMDSLYEFPLQIPFGGEVSWILVSPSL
jgi:hypothetical protein